MFSKGVSMLVLTRKRGEKIVINNDITVTVIEIRGDKIRIGVDAPKDVAVHRSEVYEAIHVRDGKVDSGARTKGGAA
jgi:carbon storage regulator